MENSGESDKRIILLIVAMVIAGGGFLVMIIQGDGGTSAVIATVCFFGVAVVGVSQLISVFTRRNLNLCWRSSTLRTQNSPNRSTK